LLILHKYDFKFKLLFILRSSVIEKKRLVAQSFLEYKRTYESTQSRLKYTNEHIFDNVYNICFNEPIPFASSSSTKINRLSNQKKNSSIIGHYQYTLLTYTDNYGSDIKISDPYVEIIDPSEIRDNWYSLNKYNRNTNDFMSTVYVYHAYAEQCAREAIRLSNQISTLLLATVKIFAFEQTRVWEDATQILRAIAPKNRFNIPNNIDDENLLTRTDDSVKPIADLSVKSIEDTSTSKSFDTSPNDACLKDIDSTNTNLLQMNSTYLQHEIPFSRRRGSISYAGKLKYFVPHFKSDFILRCNPIHDSSVSNLDKNQDNIRRYPILSRLSRSSNNRSEPSLQAEEIPSTLESEHESVENFYRVSSLINNYENYVDLTSRGGTWKDCICVATFDYYIHVFPIGSNQSITDTKNDITKELEPNLDVHNSSSTTKEYDSITDLLECVHSDLPLFSIHLRNIDVSPCIIPIMGSFDAFELRPKLSMIAAGLPLSSVPSALVYFQTSCQDMGNWLKVLTNPLCEITMDLFGTPEIQPSYVLNRNEIGNIQENENENMSASSISLLNSLAEKDESNDTNKKSQMVEAHHVMEANIEL
jgi:hypothetical protein